VFEATEAPLQRQCKYLLYLASVFVSLVYPSNWEYIPKGYYDLYCFPLPLDVQRPLWINFRKWLSKEFGGESQSLLYISSLVSQPSASADDAYWNINEENQLLWQTGSFVRTSFRGPFSRHPYHWQFTNQQSYYSDVAALKKLFEDNKKEMATRTALSNYFRFAEIMTNLIRKVFLSFNNLEHLIGGVEIKNWDPLKRSVSATKSQRFWATIH